MYNTEFFRNCVSHPNAKKNELDRFCTDCAQSFCSHCLPAHALHKHVKIRRYIYSDVINRQDLCKLFNCSGIQTYHTNKAKVVFLKQRSHHHQQQQSNSREYCCTICEKNLQDNSLYCSIACKVLDIYRDHELYRLKDEDEDEEATFLLRPTLTKKPRLRHSRKGVPLRAPMF
ncbi:RGF1-INDUCIBLE TRANSCRIPTION FACTOR 1 [Hibiscus trionum]|uniref:RGF1-INDUCIBLE TRANSCRIPTION FACTOR 1 n=1 Tax=Hibiscus trionum TaxID=183268 RepID=A0A9W7IXQ0_HIBTR|nr:RGF1-INDUCIBLE TRANSCRIPTION FACTOR 1 [Hibiscus trionum]